MQGDTRIPYDKLFNTEYMPAIEGLDPEKRNMALIEKLLGLDMELLDSLSDSDAIPTLSDEHYVPWLSEPNTLEDLFCFLTGRRRDGSMLYPPWKVLPGQLRSEAIQEQATTAQQRLSYNVMHLFTSWDADFAKVVKANLSRVTQLIFHSLDPNSIANLYHFHRIVESLQKALDYTFMDELSKNCMIYFPPLVALCEEPPVGDMLIALLGCKFANVKYRRSYYAKLLSVQIFSKLSERICSTDTHLRVAQAVAEFLDKLIETVSPIDGSEDLFDELVGSSEVVDRIANVIISTNENAYGDRRITEERKRVCAEALSSLIHYTTHQFFETSQLTGMETLNSRELSNNFAMITDQLYVLLLPHLVPLIREFLALETTPSEHSLPLKFSCGIVPHRFTQYRFLLLEIITGIVAMKPLEALDSVPDEFWDLLVKLFIEFRFNNMYHILFFRAVLLAVKESHSRALHRIFQHNQLLNHIIQRFQKRESAAESGFAILLANALRLASAERGNTGDIAELLKKCDLWASFEPVLREKTEGMVRRLCPSKATDRVKQHYNPYTFNFGNLKRAREDITAPGIDLGSRYAAALGFGEGPQSSTLRVPSASEIPRRSSSSSFVSLRLPEETNEPTESAASNVKNATVPGEHDTPRPQLIKN